MAKLLASRKGATAVEFALLSMVVIFFIIGIIEFGRILWIQDSLQFATEEAARYAMVNTTLPDDDIIVFAKNRITGVNPAVVTFSLTREVVGTTVFVTIRAEAPVTYITGSLLPGGPFNLSGQTRVPLQE